VKNSDQCSGPATACRGPNWVAVGGLAVIFVGKDVGFDPAIIPGARCLMRVRGGLLAAVVLSLTAIAWGDDVKEVEKKLQGKWKMVSVTMDGQERKADEIKNISVVVKGNVYHVHRDDEVLKLTFRLPGDTKPQAIDLVPEEGKDKGKSFRAILQLEGDTFKMCRHLEPEKARPTEFVSKGGSMLVLSVYKRAAD
jgi:uncharacterized protein (TIGR03067 family)